MILDLLDNGSSTRTAISAAGGPLATYAGLRAQVEALAAELNRLGLGRGDRIAMALPNGPEVIASFLAASSVGTAAPLNPAYTRDEFKFYLEDTGARALIVPPAGLAEARAAAGDSVPRRAVAAFPCQPFVESVMSSSVLDSAPAISLRELDVVSKIRRPAAAPSVARPAPSWWEALLWTLAYVAMPVIPVMVLFFGQLSGVLLLSPLVAFVGSLLLAVVAAIAVLIMAFLGVLMWVGFKATLGNAQGNVDNQVNQIGK